eukprot:388813-Amphidinium_carterae.2
MPTRVCVFDFAPCLQPGSRLVVSLQKDQSTNTLLMVGCNVQRDTQGGTCGSSVWCHCLLSPKHSQAAEAAPKSRVTAPKPPPLKSNFLHVNTDCECHGPFCGGPTGHTRSR